MLCQVENGQIDLDAPIGGYLPKLVPGARGTAITVRTLLTHTSGLAEYLPYASPSSRRSPTSPPPGPTASTTTG
ncbi:serine hydrolase [Streptomyces sp. OfavH-34-F]|uniref:serine hydrolase n=1 Tax=Streptomyces sp. OfavH-34-F TaxID=2917760 RepID=UPI0035B2146D